MIVFVPHITPRHRYVFDHIFVRGMGISYSLCSDLDVFNSSQDPVKLAYSPSRLQSPAFPTGCLFFCASGLLEERDIRPQSLAVMQVDGLPIFFQVENGALSFDPFASSFYLLSRYEEYLPFTPDSHGRFPAEASLAVRCGFLQIPVVDHYIRLVARVIHKEHPEIAIDEPKFKGLSTIDVDQAFAYKYKGAGRAWGALVRDVISLKWRRVTDKFLVFTGLKPDPFNSFSGIKEVHSRLNLHPIFFFLLGSHGAYDKNINPNHSAMKMLLKSTSDWASCGIHPSYASNQNNQLVQKESALLAERTGKKVVDSRQHFLKIHLPYTYRHLAEAGIARDYSMGFADLPGFRASTSMPFMFYDLRAEEQLPVELIPITYMDGTLKDYMGLSTEQAYDVIIELARQVQKVGGTFVSLWHNHSLSNYGEWKGWNEVFNRSWNRILNEGTKTA